jgi:hypothetical protein
MSDVQIFGVERLEDRLLMAVNITQNGVNLIIEGDADYDLIRVIGTGEGEVTVYADTDGDGYADVGCYSGVNQVLVNAGDGNNVVIVSDLDIDGNLTVNGGDGTDTIRIERGLYAVNDIGGNVSLDTGGSGSGLESVFVSDANIDGKLTIDTGAGRSFVRLQGELDVAGKTSIDTGAGDDRVDITPEGDHTELGDLVISTGSGDDSVFFEPASGADVTIQGRTDIDLGTGDDFLEISLSADANLTFAGNFSADGGDGDYDIFYNVGDAAFEGKFTERNFEYVY